MGGLQRLPRNDEPWKSIGVVWMSLVMQGSGLLLEAISILGQELSSLHADRDPVPERSIPTPSFMGSFKQLRFDSWPSGDLAPGSETTSEPTVLELVPRSIAD